MNLSTYAVFTLSLIQLVQLGGKEDKPPDFSLPKFKIVNTIFSYYDDSDNFTVPCTNVF